MKKYYALNELSDKLKEEGLPNTRTWIYRMMKKGRLSLPTQPFSNRYILTEKIINDCVESLKNKGEYHK